MVALLLLFNRLGALAVLQGHRYPAVPLCIIHERLAIFSQWNFTGSPVYVTAFNPNPIGLFWGLESIGGGGGGAVLAPPQISATNGPIDSKIGTVGKTSQVELKMKKMDLYFFFIIKNFYMQIFDEFWGKIGIFI